MKGPNLLFVFADQWRGQTIGFRNHEVLTPNMDRFAKESAVFNNAVTACPLCSPYRACLFTGKYPESTGVYGNCMTGYNIALREEEECFSDVLKDNGYQSGYIGKWHLDEPENNFTEHPVSGATDWDAYTPPGKKRHGFDYWYAYNACNEHMHQHYWQDTAEKIETDCWSPQHETNNAIAYIDRCSGQEKPFALFLSWNPPHTPFDQVPQKYLDLYKDREITLRANVQGDRFNHQTGEHGVSSVEELSTAVKQYYAAVSGLDDQFGRLITELKELGIYQDTIIVLTADHGEHLGSHGLMGKHTWYEESVNVPLMIHYPRKALPAENDFCINTVDLMPTILGMMKLQPPTASKGRDLSRMLAEGSFDKESYAYISAYISRDAFIEAFRERQMTPFHAGWRAVRTKRYTYVIFRGYMPADNPQILLYDRKKDPFQLSPIKISGYGDHPMVPLLHEKLLGHLKEENLPFFDFAKNLLE